MTDSTRGPARGNGAARQRPIDPALAPLLERLARVGGEDDNRPPEQVLHELESLGGELASALEPRRRAAKVKETGQMLERLRASIVERKSLEDLPALRSAVEAHRRALGIPDPKPPRRRFGFADALEDRPPPKSVCWKLEWEVGRPPMLVGAPGAGKTYVAQAAILDMVAGRALWGCPDFRVPRGLHILHIDLDQGVAKTLRRYKRLLRGKGVTSSDERVARAQFAESYGVTPEDLGSFHVDEGEGLVLRSLEPDELARWKKAWLDAVRGFDATIVDSLRRLAPFLDENDSRFSVVPDTLRVISDEAQCVILLLHHASNKGRPQQGKVAAPAGTRGSSAIDGAAGTQIVIEEDESGRRVTQNRAGEAAKLAPFYLVFEDEEPTPGTPRGLRVVYKTAEQAKAPEKSANAEKVRALADKALQYIRSQNARGRGVPGRKAVVLNVEGNDGLLYAALDQLLDEGRVVDRPEKDALGKKRPRLWAEDMAPKEA